MPIARHPSGHCAIRFADHAINWEGYRFYCISYTNYEFSKHSGTQLILGISDLGADRYPMSACINSWVNLSDLTFKRASRVGHHCNFHRLSDTERGAVAFRDISNHPFGRDIRDGVRRRGPSRLHEKPRHRIHRCYLTDDWTASPPTLGHWQ